jgi:hypothetical protein
MKLMQENQFDTIIEHFSYFSFLTVEQVFAAHGLTLFDVDELPTTNRSGSMVDFAKIIRSRFFSRGAERGSQRGSSH